MTVFTDILAPLNWLWSYLPQSWTRTRDEEPKQQQLRFESDIENEASKICFHTLRENLICGWLQRTQNAQGLKTCPGNSSWVCFEQFWLVINIGPFPATFLIFFSSFQYSIVGFMFADVWIRTAELWYR